MRGDVSGHIGWLAVDPGGSGRYNGDDWDHSFFGAVGAGWYWTDHVKSELDLGAGTKAESYLTTQVTVNNLQGFRVVERTSSRRILGISQQYQFFRNAWFHPHIAAGANLTWERRDDLVRPVTVYDPVARISRVVEAERRDGPRTEFDVRAFVAAGFKAYMTRRAFFRSDLRVGFKNGIDETIPRLGFGADF